ncbi:phosphate/phosphite/phosphonate ABC transporter substrate-binding protein [Lysobacter sp. ISL-42]|nr:phosphate/phosphite/phosphonate ABC transporter substrate-binding protein [Lysobacter sp. ISL-42]MBT2751371.1 phosphate/phosphite/phosphonate ABC transporter substrate-binding protein [Lysobacter sp. ISL-50]MBT2777313.1 phosphate/phosphite/phosphonate ABC transporter substrate-binding protein [Lysobacter sp. ISL-54]MBT2781611.1 phosphate/phosphite/phosphonate ABC transporter substrate-binding protein [Lysobacter sp. ISL-52]
MLGVGGPAGASSATADAHGRAEGGSDAHVLVLGRISDDPKAHYEQLKPLLDYVVPRMADVGIREGRILMAKDVQQMGSYLRRGRVDWVSETAGTAMLLHQRADARSMLLTERDGVSHYHSVFFARRDSGLRSLDDLSGHNVAFQRPSSTSAYFVPAATLLERGLSLEILLSPTDRINQGAVGYLFARSELNISTWVHKRLVDVGVMSNLDWNNPRRVPDAFRRDLVEIGRSEEYPRAVEVVRHDLDPKVAARLREVLLDAAGDPDAGEALLRFFKTTRFMPIDPASQRALDHLALGVARVRAEVE